MSEKLKILLVSTSSGSQGGGELCLIYQGRALAKLGHSVTLWVSDHERMDPLCEHFKEIGEIVRYPYTNTYDYKTRSLRHLSSVFTRNKDISNSWLALKPDIIHLNKQNLEDGLDLVNELSHTDIPSILFMHITQSASYLEAKYAGIRDWMARYFINRYKGPVVTTTNRTEQLCDFLGGMDRIKGIDNGTTVPILTEYERLRKIGRDALGVDEDTFVIMGIGRLEPQKRPDRFREMAYKLQQKIPGSQVVWVGAGRLEHEWQAWVEENEINEDTFSRVGWQKDVFPYLAASDLYLHPAGFEGMPFSLLEAMAWHNPCVIMDELASELQYFNEDVAIIASDADDSWLAKALNVEDREKVKVDSRKFIEERFSIERMAKDYVDLYHDVIS